MPLQTKTTQHYHLIGGDCSVAAQFNSCVFLTAVIGIGALGYLVVKNL